MKRKKKFVCSCGRFITFSSESVQIITKIPEWINESLKFSKI